jgi:hypothetical protein
VKQSVSRMPSSRNWEQQERYRERQWDGHTGQNRENKEGISGGKCPPGKPRKYEHNIKTDLRKIVVKTVVDVTG